MSDVMLFGVLRMPYELAMGDDVSRRQFYNRAREAADRIERLEAANARLHAQLSAQSVSAVQPVAWMWEYHGTQVTASKEESDDVIRCGTPVTPLYTHPADADAVDAKRYRWLREHIQDCSHDGLVTVNTAIEYHGAEDFDEAIDAAMAQSTEGAKG